MPSLRSQPGKPSISEVLRIAAENAKPKKPTFSFTRDAASERKQVAADQSASLGVRMISVNKPEAKKTIAEQAADVANIRNARIGSRMYSTAGRRRKSRKHNRSHKRKTHRRRR
jgi:hypothetical protein